MPEKRFIKIGIVIRVLGFLLLIESAFMLSGLFFAWYYGESIWPLLISALITGITGIIVWFTVKPDIKKKGIGKREGYLIRHSPF